LHARSSQQYWWCSSALIMQFTMLPSNGHLTRRRRLPAAENDTSADPGRSVRKLYWGSSEIGFGHTFNANTVGDTDGALP